MRDSYKQARHEDDLNQPLSVQPWGVDGLKRRYWLIEGQDDTNFRLYREDRQFPLEPIWWNIAGTIEEVKAVANVLETKDKSQAARRLSSRINSAIPRFEATEEVTSHSASKLRMLLMRYYRNAEKENIDKYVELNLPDRIRNFQVTKGEHVVKELDMHWKMKMVSRRIG